MYDLSKEFKIFYNNHVVLPGDKQQELRDKKDINIKRLENGLKEYNEENNTDYKIAEKRVQGSMAMHTVVQNDENNYDIDVAIIFDKSNLNGLTPLQARRMVRDALAKKCGQLNVEPECKTNCVRVQYATGYHVDFAVYRRFKDVESSEYSYEHAGGSNWNSRNPAAITKWFQDEVHEKGTELRQVVRFSKMFCKSRSFWVNMPGGLIQSVVCDEKFTEDYDRIDEIFYYTMIAVRDRLNDSQEIYNPTDTELSLLTAQNHYTKVENWCSRLNAKLAKLDILLEEDCTYEDAVNAWNEFFNHEYWGDLKEAAEAKSVYEFASLTKTVFKDTEEYIEDLVPINDCYEVDIDCKVEANGIRNQSLQRFLIQYPQFQNLVPHGLTLYFKASTNVPHPDAIWWKIRNCGKHAEARNQIRGQIEKKYWTEKIEDSEFGGRHYVECYVIKNNECVAIKRLNVPIGEKSI